MAVALYWWLASHFDWPWIAFIGLIAAPMLLLRSPESVERGVEMLGRYWSRKEQIISERERAVIILISALATGLVVYWLDTSWRPGWTFYWRATAIGTIANAIAIAITSTSVGLYKYMGAGTDAGSSTSELLAGGTIGGAIAGATLGSGVAAGVAAGLGTGVTTYVTTAVLSGTILAVMTTRNVFMAAYGINNKAAENIVLVFENPYRMFQALFTVIGVLLRGLLIRWVATLSHLRAGLANLPRNWRETMLVIDLLHPPELLPQAGRINYIFTVRGNWRNVTQKPSDAWGKIFSLTFLLAWYLPALVYRWSLKSSAWLWWPLAWALSSPLEGLDGKMSRERTAISIGGAWRLLLPLVSAVVFAWLIISALPGLDFLLTIVPEVATKLADKLLHLVAPPPFGVRLIALWLGCVLALVFWWRTKNLKASHVKVLESPKEFNDLRDEDKERFLQLARPIEKLRLLLIVAVLVLCEAYAISIFHAINPSLAEKLFAPCLFQIL